MSDTDDEIIIGSKVKSSKVLVSDEDTSDNEEKEQAFGQPIQTSVDNEVPDCDSEENVIDFKETLQYNTQKKKKKHVSAKMEEPTKSINAGDALKPSIFKSLQRNQKKRQKMLMEIKSETQRMIRKGTISLPYHQPKQRSLDDFLKKRRSVPCIPLKPSTGILEDVWKQATKYEEEVVQFYKSDSEHSDDESASVQIENSEDSLPTPAVELNLETCAMEGEEDVFKICEALQTSDTDVSKESTNNIVSSLVEIEERIDITADSDVTHNESVEDTNVECNEDTDNNEGGSVMDISQNDEHQKLDDAEKIVEEQKSSEHVSPKNILIKNPLSFAPNQNLQNMLKFKGDPNAVIDIEITSYRDLGFENLMNKYVKHVLPNNQPKKGPTTVSVVNAEKDSQGEITGITKEVLVLSEKSDVDLELFDPKLSKPGARYAFFKDRMRKTLLTKKEKSWAQYQKNKKIYASEDEQDDEDKTTEKESYEPEFKPYYPEDELDDEELEEDDIELKDKNKTKNAFLDDEAEESDEENDSDDEDVVADDADDSVNESEDEKLEDIKSAPESKEQAPKEDCFEKECPNDKPKVVKFDAQVRAFEKLFKMNVTGSDLENKVLGLESITSQISQNSQDVTPSQIFGICSGKFSSQFSQPKPVETSQSQFFDVSEDSQDICLTLADTNDEFEIDENQSSVVKDTIGDASLLLSDDSDVEELFSKKKKVARLVDSDDEDDADENIQSSNIGNVTDEEETTDVLNEENDDVSDEADEHVSDEEDEETEEPENQVEEDEETEEPDDQVDYNSEEEIMQNKENLRNEFFENEAELSESEWGSEDENEKDLDEFEKEAGDADDIDTEKLKEELGKIHMRQMLDDDQHEVRLLKEMLLEDGDLHSDTKRQRKFQWKNLSDEGDFYSKNIDSDDENKFDDQDDETEQEWRRIRHEREAFISKQDANLTLSEEYEDESDRSYQYSKTIISCGKDDSKIVGKPVSPNAKLPFGKQHKCGSFLSRGKLLLSRIAVTVDTFKGNNLNGPKNTNKFVFATISPEKKNDDSVKFKSEKRKSLKDAVSVAKRLKLSQSNSENSVIRNVGILGHLEMDD